MPRYKLRTLLIVLAIGPPVLAWGIPAVLSLPNMPGIYIPAWDFTSHVMDNQSYMITTPTRDGKIVIGKNSYGPVKAGDQIRLGPGDHVFVNDQLRSPE
jgi:hypothetical protein